MDMSFTTKKNKPVGLVYFTVQNHVCEYVSCREKNYMFLLFATSAYSMPIRKHV